MEKEKMGKAPVGVTMLPIVFALLLPIYGCARGPQDYSTAASIITSNLLTFEDVTPLTPLPLISGLIEKELPKRLTFCREARNEKEDFRP